MLSSESSEKRSALVLIVDVDATVGEVIRAILVAHGYAVVLASDGWEACRMVQGSPEKIALVIAEVTMPHMNGIELSKRLKGIDSQLPVLLISGFAPGPVHDHLDERVSFLQKPFMSQALVAKVRAGTEWSAEIASAEAQMAPA
jgi:DNA-binding NtrC family response regulator